MCKILLSIKPEYVEKIFDGSKKYEFRRTCCKKEIQSVVIYSTYPIMKVVGEAQIKQVLCDSPEFIWDKTQHKAGISKEFFMEYFEGKDVAIAYELKKVRKYAKSRSLSDYGIKTAPQSFRYIEEEY